MKDKIFAVELSYDTVPENIYTYASKFTQNISEWHKELKQNRSPYFILNTCRRLTIFCVSSCPGKTLHFFEAQGIEKHHLKIFKGTGAVQHILEIAAGLKSPNIGENEILYQLKNVLKESGHLKILDVFLRKLLQKSIETGRRVRYETAILQSNLSYPAIVQKVLNENKTHINKAKLLIIGNGNLGKNCIKYFLNRNAHITLATRNPQRTIGIDSSVNVISRDVIRNALDDMQIVIGAASSLKPVVVKSDVKRLKNKPVFIDLAMPANFDPAISSLGEGILFNLDHIFKTARMIKKEKSHTLKQAKNIIEEEKNSYINWLKGRKAVKIISTLKEELELIKSQEHSRLMDDLGEIDLNQKKIIDNLVNRLTSRIAHVHYSHIKDFVVHEQS